MWRAANNGMSKRTWMEKKIFLYERGAKMKKFVSFLKDEHGLETVEWVVMAAVIVLGVAVLAGYLVDDIKAALDKIGNEINPPAPA